MNAETKPSPTADKPRPVFQPRPWYRSRGWWLKQLHNWHWMTAAISMIGMLAFAATGITLNHAGSIAAAPKVTELSGTLPAPLIGTLTKTPDAAAPLPAPVAREIENRIGLDPADKPGEWSDGEVYVAMPRPGGDAWVSVDRTSGRISAEVTDRGWLSWFNDLHKGRNAGPVWGWFLDIFAVACILFTLTGLFLLAMHARPRPLTWPLVDLGVIIPAILILLFMH